jgi:hypothetical protein
VPVESVRSVDFFELLGTLLAYLVFLAGKELTDFAEMKHSIEDPAELGETIMNFVPEMLVV